MKKKLLQLKKAAVMLTLTATVGSLSLENDVDGINHLDRLLMVGEITQDEYDFYKDKLEDGIDPILRLQMVGEDPNYDYSQPKSYTK